MYLTSSNTKKTANPAFLKKAGFFFKKVLTNELEYANLYVVSQY